ncbi:MAG TPA: TIR domain-containing protein [Thermoanaerobaculia bacterium]|nr:TIR domain-containing protein [Thermoanaerobaculia bacterium]
MPKPRLFVGSSQEGLEVARAVEFQLADDGEVTLWNEGVFGLGRGNLESLVLALDTFDVAVIVLTPDDLLVSRDDEYRSVRDNVLIELGLFLGRFGRERTFIVFDRDSGIKVPSDLAGVSFATFSSKRTDGNLTAALGPSCTQIRSALRRLGEAVDKKIAEVPKDFRILRGPQQILEVLVEALESLNVEKVVLNRVIPMEFTAEHAGSSRVVVERYQKIIRDIINKGEADIGFWDKTIYGRAFNESVRRSTIDFIFECFMPCPDTSFIGVDETYNHIGFMMLGETETGFPSDFVWRYGIAFFGDPESSRPTPLYGFVTENHEFIECVLHRWWLVLQRACERKGQFWDARNYIGKPEEWNGILGRIKELIMTGSTEGA